jgi:DNA-binding winged helix-turn-helix (wHTH) protein
MADNGADSDKSRTLRLLTEQDLARSEGGFNHTDSPVMQGFGRCAASSKVRHGSFQGRSPVLGPSISFGPFTLYPTARLIEKSGARLTLGSRALDILIVLTERVGEVVSHKELTQRVWRSLMVTSCSLRVHMTGLRKALGEGDGGTRYIANVPGQGYCFVAPVRQHDCDESSSAAVPLKQRILPSAPLARAGIASPPHPALRKQNLLNPHTTFAGRENEIQQIKGLLTSTRLLAQEAMAIAQALQDETVFAATLEAFANLSSEFADAYHQPRPFGWERIR